MRQVAIFNLASKRPLFRRYPVAFIELALLSSCVTLAHSQMAVANAKVLAGPSFSVSLDTARPRVLALSVDSLGHGHLLPDPLVDQSKDSNKYVVRIGSEWISYAGVGGLRTPLWTIRRRGSALYVTTRYSRDAARRDLPLEFDPSYAHATVLGRVSSTGGVALPALLHLPGMGSMRISATGKVDRPTIGFEAHRSPKNFVRITLPAATKAQRTIAYKLETADIHPSLPSNLLADPSYDSFRRDFLDAFQMQAGLHVLANNSASDPCPFVLYFYADMARYLPPLAPGLTAMDLVRDSLNRYLSGFAGYGMPGYQLYDLDQHSSQKYTLLDVYPSLIISAYDYVSTTEDIGWLTAHFAQLQAWANQMNVGESKGSPLLEYPLSGDSGSWPEKVDQRPANWWDTIGFGFQDAYSNALGYRAYRSMAALAIKVGKMSESNLYADRAAEIKALYSATFMNPETGVLAGWRSRDGHLHDYFFMFVNGIAVKYGLLDRQTATGVIDKIWSKMDEVGYKDFSLGLPGNLLPIGRNDYVDLNPRYGGPTRADGSDGFQVYENGGATSCFAYFSIAAFYAVGQQDRGDMILKPMLAALGRQGFSGKGADGMSNDWKDWQGNAHGYEGFLVDNYYTLMAVLDRNGKTIDIP